MIIKVERRLFRIGEGAIAVTLPKAWTRFHQLEPGDKVEIIADNELTIRVNLQKSAKRNFPESEK